MVWVRVPYYGTTYTCSNGNDDIYIFLGRHLPKGMKRFLLHEQVRSENEHVDCKHIHTHTVIMKDRTPQETRQYYSRRKWTHYGIDGRSNYAIFTKENSTICGGIEIVERNAEILMHGKLYLKIVIRKRTNFTLMITNYCETLPISGNQY